MLLGIKLFIATLCLSNLPVNGDGCSDICDRFPGTCGSGGSYCKGTFCHDLFWADSTHTVLCHHQQPGCPQSDSLLCTDVGRYTGIRFGVPVTHRSTASATTSSTPTSSSTTRTTTRSATTTTSSTTTSTPQSSSSRRRVVDIRPPSVRPTAPATTVRVGPLPGIQGIPNLGAICYFSSILQPLLHSAAFREATLGLVSGSSPSSPGARVVAETAALTQRMWFPEGVDVEQLFTNGIVESMRQFTNNRMFVIGTADDSAWAVREYISALLNGNMGVYGPIFQTRVRTYQQCHSIIRCIPTPTIEDRNMIIVAPGSRSTITNLIRNQFQAGIIAGHACDVCGSSDPGVVRTPTIVRASDLLVVAIERRDPSVIVDIPIEMDLTGVVPSEDPSGPLLYRLVGISIHHGDHYTSEFRHPDTNQWYAADDSRVRAIASPSVSGTHSRVVVYERV